MLFAGRDETSAGRGAIWPLLRGRCLTDENILVFKASCWETLLCALISTTPIQIQDHFSDQTDANINMQESAGSKATSESASEAQSPQMQNRKQNRWSRVLLCTKGGTFIRLLENKSGHRVLGNRWYCDVPPLCFWICITLIRHAQENIGIS